MAYCGVFYNCSNAFAEAYVPGDCGEFFLGGISGIGITLCDVNIADPSSATEINALIASNSIKIITGVRGELTAPSPVNVDSFISCVPEVAVTYDRVMNLADRNVTSDNIEFYNSINSAAGFTSGGLLLYLCDSDEVLYVNAPVRLSGGLIVPPQNNELQRFEFTLAWRDAGDPTKHAAPAGIF